jgi:splicing factor 3B subunit 3
MFTNCVFFCLPTDTGRIVIVKYNSAKNCLGKVHEETFGKSRCRRIVPRQYLAIDPKGRAVMIGAVKKQKLVYILNRDTEARLAISSPLEAHKSSTLTYHIVGIRKSYVCPLRNRLRKLTPTQPVMLLRKHNKH